MLTDIEKTTWKRAGELLGEITKQLNPKGVRVTMELNETFDAVEVSARVSANGKTWAMRRLFQLNELAYAINRDVSHFAGDFCSNFLDTLAEHAAELARERRG